MFAVEAAAPTAPLLALDLVPMERLAMVDCACGCCSVSTDTIPMDSSSSISCTFAIGSNSPWASLSS